ncbi:hypothetical protein ABQE93_03425 [Mycolicibacterium sp. XJ662]
MITNGSTAFVGIETPMPTGEDHVALVLNAGTESGYRIARDLLCSGYRVAVTDRHAPRLTRILAGVSAKRVVAIAAEPSDTRQVFKLVERVQAVFGRRIELVIRAEDDDEAIQ